MDCKEYFRRKIKLFEEMEAFLEQFRAEDQFSGTVLCAQDNQPLFQKAYGMTEKNFNVPAQIGTRFKLASMNKRVSPSTSENGRLQAGWADPKEPECIWPLFVLQ